MKIVTGLTLFFYTIVFLLIGGIFITVSLNIIPQGMVTDGIATLRLTAILLLGMVLGYAFFEDYSADGPQHSSSSSKSE